MDPFQFSLQFTVELSKLSPQIPVTALEPGFPLEIVSPVMPHQLKQYVALGLGIKGNPLPQISYMHINWTLLLMESSPMIFSPTIFTDVVSYKISNSSIRNIYTHVGVHLTAGTINYMTPKLLDLGFYTIDVLD